MGPTCSLLACRRKLGRSLLEPEYPIYWNGTGVEPDRTTDVHARDDIWTFDPSGHQGGGPDSIREMGERLKVRVEEQTAAMVYSRRRRKWVKVHYGCFACSKDCYDNIILAIRLWEGPLEMHQAVVITAVHCSGCGPPPAKGASSVRDSDEGGVYCKSLRLLGKALMRHNK